VLPVEAAADAPPDPAQALQALLAFHLHGRRPAGVADASGPAPLPALLHRYRDLARVRHEFPVLIDPSDAANPVRPLTRVVDDFLAGVASGDDGQQLRHNILRLESVMRALLENRDADRLALVWDRAAATLFETSRLPDDKAAVLRDNVKTARRALPSDGDLVDCGPSSTVRIFRACVRADWSERCAPWREELGTVIGGLQNILAADFSRSDDAMTPDHLRDTLGTASDDVDVQAMSSLLRSAPHEGGLSQERRERVRAALETLAAMQPVFGTGVDPETEGPAPFAVDSIFGDVASARAEHRRRMQAMTAFFRAVRAARLEIQNRYRDTVHGAYFRDFGERHLTDAERALCPPVLVHVADDDLGGECAASLLDVLNSTDAIKLLVEIRRPCTVDADSGALAMAWPGLLASLALALNHPYVMQAPASRPTLLAARIRDGLRVPGPALFCVGAPEPGDRGLPAYLAAAATTEARMLPVVAFDPSQGETLAARTDIGDNPQNERTWVTESFAYRNQSGDETRVELAFTPADVLFCDGRLADHFWTLPASMWHEHLMPLHELLELPEKEAAGRIPYIHVVDRENRLGRAVVSPSVLDVSRRFRSAWRALRESCGIENSFAERVLAVERERLSKEKEREIDEIEKNYVAQLEQDVGELTREIVARIAGQLMGVDGGSVAPPPVRPAPPAPAGAPPAAVPAADAPEPAAGPKTEGESLSLDEPYIDTPLCTSCNECTQLNSRIFRYNANKQAEIFDATAGPFSDLVQAAELCPVHIIHPGKPRNPDEPNLEEWTKRAARYN
jgi:ferredoxin